MRVLPLPSKLAMKTLPRGALSSAAQQTKSAIVAAICAASLTANPACSLAAAQPTMDEAIVEFTEALYPIIAVQNKAFPALTEQVGALIFKSIEPAKLAKSIDISLDALASVPSDKIAAFNGVVKEAFDGLKTEDCALTPLPPRSLVDNVLKTEAVKLVDTASYKKWDDAWGGTLKLLPKTDSYVAKDGEQYSVICLPTPEQLDKLALAQADIGRAIGRDELKAFGDYVPATLKAGIRPTDAMPIAQTASKLAYIPPEQKIRLTNARKGVEAAAKAEADKVRIEEIKAKAAANRAAMQAASK